MQKQQVFLEAWRQAQIHSGSLLIAFALLMSFGCQTFVEPQRPTLPMGLKPFSDLGGYSPGDIVFIGNDGYPNRCVPADVSKQYGKVKTGAEPEPIRDRKYSTSDNFLGTVKANAARGEISGSTNNQLTRLASLTLNITEAQREYLADGTAAYSHFFLNAPTDQLRRFSSLVIESCGMGEVALITDVLKVTRGFYFAEWSTELDLGAQAKAVELIGGEISGRWDNNRKATIEITRPMALGYRDWPLQMERLREARDTGIYPLRE